MRTASQPAPLSARLFAAGALAAAALGGGLTGPAAAQVADPAGGARGTDAVRAGAAETITLQHSFPLAGSTLVIVVAGLPPRGDVWLKLADPAEAPVSVLRHLTSADSPGSKKGMTLDTPGFLSTIWVADEFGRLVLSIPLTDPADADRPVTLQAVAMYRQASEVLHLQVQPPTLVLPAQDGLARINLLDGSVLLPPLPLAGGLRGAALSPDGVLGYVLRDGGLLEVRGTHQWAGLPLSQRLLDPAADSLAGSVEQGVAFALVRPAGVPYTPGGALVFLGEDERRAPVLLEPMGQSIAGRRAVVSADGLSAFVAEDDLIVREVDLLSGAAHGLLPVGLAGDGAITDLLLDGRQLLVATRGPLGRRGSLTTYDLDAGVLSTHQLDVDPLRFVALGDGRVLVVPANGGMFQLIETGVPGRTVNAEGRWLDAVPSGGGALLLRELPGGVRALDRFDPVTGILSPEPVTGPAGAALPPVLRLVGGAAGGAAGAVVLLGDPSGAVHVLAPGSDAVSPLPGVTALAGGTFAVLP